MLIEVSYYWISLLDLMICRRWSEFSSKVELHSVIHQQCASSLVLTCRKMSAEGVNRLERPSQGVSPPGSDYCQIDQCGEMGLSLVGFKIQV